MAQLNSTIVAGDLVVAGDALITGVARATTFNATSDKRLKTNLRPAEISQNITSLPVYKYDFISGPKDQIGCMAQDLLQICPELVTTGEDGYLSIQESKLVYLLLEEVKILKSRLDKLEERNVV